MYNNCTAVIQKYKSIFNKKKKKYDKIILLAKTDWNCMEVIISKALIDSHINHDEFMFSQNMC